MITGEHAAEVARALGGALSWRSIGPYRGGRVMAVAGHPTRPRVCFFGSASGGVWKTEDDGVTWRNISDGFFRRASVGALAMAESDPNVVYAGMGECGMRGNVTHGDGVYRSTDGGATWVHAGLADTQNIARVRVHPRDPELVYVAAFGHRFGPNPERGVYRSRDGGLTWERILSRGDRAGAIDLAMDPSNPRVLYAALWQAQRYPWGLVDRGPESGLYKSRDGGDSWVDLTRNPGLPHGLTGRIGVCVSPADPNRLWALVDAEEGGGVYRSNDGGATWTWTNADRNFLARSWYSTHLVADPRDADTVYNPNRKLWKSVDGGRTFVQLNTPYWDQHDLWVDPRDPSHMAVGTDGGAAISRDGGQTWSTVVNQPTAELYSVATDDRFPYRVYSAQQDNSTLSLPSRSDRGPISLADLYDVGGGESSAIAVRPDNPNIVYASDLDGILTRYDHASGQLRDISVWPGDAASPDGQARSADDPPYRFNWSTPVALSPHDPGVLYTAANRLFRSTDEGASWRTISPDLTRDDRAVLDLAAAENGDCCTIAAFAESPRMPGVLWVGSDDGLIHLSRDGGASWRDVTPPGLPGWASANVEASPHDPAGAYVAATRHKLDDFRPYLFKTADDGATWEAIAAGIPDDLFVRVIHADPVRRGLLYAGTEAGVYASWDDGASWHSLQLDLPVVAIYDIAVKGDGLIAATHGRGLWILDDVTPLRQVTDDTLDAPIHLFAPRPAYRVAREAYGLRGYIHQGFAYGAANPPEGVVVTYYLRDEPAGGLTLSLRDGAGREVASAASAPVETRPAPLGPYDYALRYGTAVLTAKGQDDEEPGIRVGALTRPAGPPAHPPARAGFNRFALGLLYPGAPALPGQDPADAAPPLAVPGTYEVRLTVGETVLTTSCEVRKDPRVSTPDEDLAAQFTLMLDIRDRVSAVRGAVKALRDLRRRLDAWVEPWRERPEGRGAWDAATRLRDRLSDLERGLIQPAYNGRSGELEGGYPAGLDDKLEFLAARVGGSDSAPTAQARAVFAALSARVDRALQDVQDTLATDLAALNTAAREEGLTAVAPPHLP